jgi:hypothetical protein
MGHGTKLCGENLDPMGRVGRASCGLRPGHKGGHKKDTKAPTEKIWVGVKRGKREIFKYHEEPGAESHGHLYGYAIGPFRTMRGAEIMRDYGANNPHLQSVAEAERMASTERKKEGTLSKAEALRQYNNLPVSSAPEEFLEGHGGGGLTEGEFKQASRLAKIIMGRR